MKMRNIFHLLITLSIVFVVVVGCASVPKKPVESPGIVFQQSLEKTRNAAIDALVVLGFDIKKQEDSYIEGYRPHKVGFFVGSGGETVGVWLKLLDQDRTSVQVKTAKSLVGIAGQKNWDENVLNEMRKVLQ